MRRVFIVLLLLALVVSGIALVPPSVTAQDGTDPMQHTVQPGESLFSIAQQYSVTVDALAAANGLTVDSTLFAGQVLVIPGTGNEPAEQDPTMTPAPGETIHVVQAGENLFRIANRYGTTVQAIMNLNGITDPNRIFVGQQLRIPGTQAPPDATESPVPAEEIETATDTPSGDGDEDQPDETETPTETPFVPGDPDEAENEAASVPFDFGVVVQLQNQENQPVVERIEELEVSWAKQRVDWALYEPSRGNYTFENLDVIIDDLDSAGVNIMLTVTSAPTWARASSEESGPPTDYQDYAIFVGRLAQRYQGRVDAYEIWHEPNLRQNWNGKPINGAEYVELLRVAYGAIKTADPEAVVVTAGLAPTGLSDGVNAEDDRLYLQQMYAAGVAQYSDAIGAHPYGWANPPDTTCCENNPNILNWDDHPSFFFMETLQAYWEIMQENNDSGTFIWVTEFGWGTSDGFQVDVDENFAFVENVTLDEQAQYTIRAFQIGRNLGYVGPMFVWNLNACEVYGLGDFRCYWSLLDPAGNPRPAYLALRDLTK